MASRSKMAETLSKHIGYMLDEIVKADNTSAEDTAHYCNIMILFLREIMYNTAIIADYCANHSIPDYPNNEERSRAGDSFNETDC